MKIIAGNGWHFVGAAIVEFKKNLFNQGYGNQSEEFRIVNKQYNILGLANIQRKFEEFFNLYIYPLY